MTATHKRAVGLVGLIALILLSIGSSSALATGTPGVEPASSSFALSPGGSVDISKTVHTSEIPPKPDIVFLADTTGSMGSAIANVKANAVGVMNTVRASQADSEFGAAQYKDFNCDATPYKLDQAITSSTSDVSTAINSGWSAGGGCDEPEAAINALYQLATNPTTGFRSGSSRVIAWFADAPSHDPSNGATQAMAISALQAAGIRVIAISTGFDRLDLFGQGSAITTATGGVLLHTGSNVAAAILAGLHNLPVEVAPSAACDSGLSASYDHASQTVTSGADASFLETISVAPDALGGSHSCSVKFLSNGVDNGAGFTENVTIAVPNPDLALAKTGPATAQAGDLVTYTLTATNLGPSGASGASISDTVPANATYVSSDAGCSYDSGSSTVTCAIGHLANGASQAFHVTLKAGNGASITNAASLAADQADPNGANNHASATTAVNRPPDCSKVAASAPTLWPPSHTMVNETLSGATDADGNALGYSIASIWQDEKLNTTGDGTTTPDAKLLGGPSFQVRSERSGLGDGRFYHVSGTVSDGAGGSCSFSGATIVVPHDQAHAPVDGGSLYSSL